MTEYLVRREKSLDRLKSDLEESGRREASLNARIGELSAALDAARSSPPASPGPASPSGEGKAIKYLCGACGTKLSAPAWAAGRAGQCRRCGLAHTIPDLPPNP